MSTCRCWRSRKLRIGEQFLAFRQGFVELRRLDAHAGLDQQQADLAPPDRAFFGQRLFQHRQGLFQAAAAAKALAQQVQAGGLAIRRKASLPRSRQIERGQAKRLRPLFAAGLFRGAGVKRSQDEVGAAPIFRSDVFAGSQASAMPRASAVLPRSNAPRAMASVTGLGGGLRLRRILTVETTPTTTARLTAKTSNTRKRSASSLPNPARSLPAPGARLRVASASGGSASGDLGKFLAMKVDRRVNAIVGAALVMPPSGGFSPNFREQTYGSPGPRRGMRSAKRGCGGEYVPENPAHVSMHVWGEILDPEGGRRSSRSKHKSRRPKFEIRNRNPKQIRNSKKEKGNPNPQTPDACPGCVLDLWNFCFEFASDFRFVSDFGFEISIFPLRQGLGAAPCSP